MADQVDVKIITVDAVTNLNTLRQTISDAKKELNKMQIGSDAYREQLVELNKAQNLLTNALNGTTAETEDYTKALKGETKTYNTLVKQMADYKKELRNIDVSTEQGKKDFTDLAAKIKGINDELKNMDAMKGDYQRNVGNYKSALEGMIPPLKNVNDTIGLIGKQPVLGIISLLVPLITKITDELKENKTAMEGVKGLMKALQPIVKVFEGALQKIAEWAGEALAGITQFVKGALPQLKNFVAGVTGVGNAIFQFLIFPIKQTIEAVKGLGNILKDVFTGQWDKIKDDAKAAMEGINNAFNKGIDFKGNYEAGEKVGEAFVDGLSSTKLKKKAKDAGKDLIKETLKGLLEQFDKDVDKFIDDLNKKSQEIVDKAIEKEEKLTEIARKREENQLKGIEKITKRQLQYNELMAKNEQEKANNAYEIEMLSYEKRLLALSEFQEQAKARNDIEALVQYEQEFADLQVEMEMATLERKKKIREEDKKNLITTLNASASATSSILGAIADAYESNGELTEKEEKRVKNLRVAAATIEMLQGAVAAYAGAQSLGVPMGPIVGAINAAAVVAMGLANIAKIKATNVSRDSTPTSSTPTQATVQAPALDTARPTTVTTGASTERALNAASQPQKVYILQSDIEAAGDTSQVQVAESSF